VGIILIGTAALIDHITSKEMREPKKRKTVNRNLIMEVHTAEARVHQNKPPKGRATRNQAQNNKASEEKASQDFATVEQLPEGHGYDQTLESPGYVRLFAEYGMDLCCSDCGQEYPCICYDYEPYDY
jgi:hypothetical protein